jgi:hypothetical protein
MKSNAVHDQQNGGVGKGVQMQGLWRKQKGLSEVRGDQWGCGKGCNNESRVVWVGKGRAGEAMMQAGWCGVGYNWGRGGWGWTKGQQLWWWRGGNYVKLRE